MGKILIIEDEPKVANFIKNGLEENSYTSDIALDGFIGKSLAIVNPYDLIILDLNLPLINGIDVCKAIREKDKSTPVLMLTALGSIEDKLIGFESGADDYLVKPFEFSELLARVRALLKRTLHSNTAEKMLSMGDLTVNLMNMTANRNGKNISLTLKEFKLLEYFIKNRDRVITRSEIAEKIWEIKFDTGTNVIDVYVNFLRKKIDKDFEKKLIHTIIGSGYMMKEPE